MAPAILQFIAWFPTRLLLFFTGFIIQDPNNLRTMRGPVVYASNHQSQFDPILVRAALPPVNALYFASLPPEGYAHIPFGKYLYGGFLFRLWGAYPVYRKSESLGIALRNQLMLLAKHKRLLFFPEGGIVTPEKPKVPKPGIAYLEKNALAPVVLVRLIQEGRFGIRVVFGLCTPSSTEDESVRAEEIVNEIYRLH